jgi:hypothetical protein
MPVATTEALEVAIVHQAYVASVGAMHLHHITCVEVFSAVNELHLFSPILIVDQAQFPKLSRAARVRSTTQASNRRSGEKDL